MRKKAIIIPAIIVIIIIIAAILVTGQKGPKSEAVKTAAATKGELKSYLSTNAVIKSKKLQNYMGAAQFIVKSVKVNVGDTVKKDQVMLEYDLTDLQTSVNQAKLQYSNALLQKEDLLRQRDQVKDAINKLDKQIKDLESSTNPSDLLQLQTMRQKRDSIQPISDDKIKLMDNSVSLAKLSLDSASSKLSRYKEGITSEFDGVVTSVNASAGTTASPAQPAIVVQQLDNLKAIVSLGKYDALKVKEGQEVIIKNGNNNYNGTVFFINPAAAKSVTMTGQDTSLQAEIDILDKQTDLKIDFDVNVDILLGSVQDAVKIPVECIKYDKSGKNLVFKVVDGKAQQVEIKTGLQSDTEAQVTDGLSVNDTVILNPSISIKNGTLVTTSEDVK